MQKKFASIIVLFVLGLSSYLLYPTIYWYFIMDKEEKKFLTSQSLEIIFKKEKERDQLIIDLQKLFLTKNHRIYKDSKNAELIFNIRPRKEIGEILVLPSLEEASIIDAIFFKNFPEKSKDSSEYKSFLEALKTIHEIDSYFEKYEEIKRWKQSVIQLGLDLSGGTQLTVSIDQGNLVHRIKNKYKSLGLEDSTEIASIIKNKGKTDLKKIVFNKELIESKKEKPDKEKLIQAYKEELKRGLENLVDNAMVIIQNRIDKFGISEIKIQKSLGSQIFIEIPGTQKKEIESQIQEIIQAGQLSFQLVDEELMSSLPLDIYNKDPEFSYYIDPQYVIKKPFYYTLKDEILKNLDIKISENLDESSLYPVEFLSRFGVKKIIGFLVLKNKMEILGENLSNLAISYDPQKNTPDVSFTLDDQSSYHFAELTEKNIGKRLAILLDGKVKSQPVISNKIIKQGRISLSNNTYNPIEEAKNLLNILKAGSLPTQLNIEQIHSIGPSLGITNIKKGIFSILVGFIVVIIFMLLYYRICGLIAIIGLFANLFILFSILSAFHFTLTLPGIAGIILTIGMAIDANVLVFERMKETIISQSDSYLSVVFIREAYLKASTAIFDSNITTILVAFILSQLGSGLLQGFGFTLMCGILTSMFTSLFLTRFIFELIFGQIKFKKKYLLKQV